MRSAVRVDGALAVFAGSLVVLLAAVWLLTSGGAGGPASGARLFVHCAAGVRPPVEAAARDYQRRYGVIVELAYGGSGTLLSNLEVSGAGDLYVAGDDSFVAEAIAQGHGREVFQLAVIRPVIGVPAGNPAGVAALADLAREGVRVGIGNPDVAAVGRIARQVLEEEGLWDAVRANLTVEKPTVPELAVDLELGTLDAAVLFDATVAQSDSVEVVRVPAFEAEPRLVAACVLESSARPTEALRFARFLAARDEGQLHFAEHGYEPAGGDAWHGSPELLLFSGAMLNAAVDETIGAFEEREGVSVTRVYNGCGILVAQMRAGERPDAYFSCDSSFLDMVADDFGPGTTVASNALVILVKEGDPRGVGDLAGLAQPGLRLGLAHAQNSALGALTDRLLVERGLRDAVRANLAVESATADFLVAQMRAGSLDAVVVYRTSCAFALGDHDALPIPGAVATQPFAVARGSDHPHLMGRLLAAILEAESRARFEAVGFGWEAGAGE